MSIREIRSKRSFSTLHLFRTEPPTSDFRPHSLSAFSLNPFPVSVARSKTDIYQSRGSDGIDEAFDILGSRWGRNQNHGCSGSPPYRVVPRQCGRGGLEFKAIYAPLEIASRQNLAAHQRPFRRMMHNPEIPEFPRGIILNGRLAQQHRWGVGASRHEKNQNKDKGKYFHFAD